MSDSSERALAALMWLGTDAYAADRELMQSLGLRVRRFGCGWTDLGTVTVREAETEIEYDAAAPRPATTVRVEVCAMPAQFWRFTITRPRDEIEELGGGAWRAVYEPVEVFVMTTGSGQFREYWPMAEAVAHHMVGLERVS